MPAFCFVLADCGFASFKADGGLELKSGQLLNKLTSGPSVVCFYFPAGSLRSTSQQARNLLY